MPDQLLTIQDLSIVFGNAKTAPRSVDKVNLTIDKGQTVALVGESGSGKSITALSIMQLLPYPLAKHPSGSIQYGTQELVGAGPTVLESIRGNQVSMIFQEPMTSLNPLHTIEKQISESLRLHKGLNRKASRNRVLELLELVGIKQAKTRLHSYPHELSGGQRQRVMIAMALANEPELLIADEPTTALDVTIQAQILELLSQLQKQFGMALLLITHDLGIVRKMADSVYVMHQGNVVEHGPAQSVFSSPQHAYTQRLLAAEPGEPPQRASDEANLLLSARDILVQFPIKKNFLGFNQAYLNACNQISLNLKAGRTLGIVGESGSGKTTLGLALLRLIKSSGKIEFDGEQIDHMGADKLRQLRQSMQIVFQDPYGSLSPRLSVLQIIEEGLTVHHPSVSKQQRQEQVSQVLSEVGLPSDAMHRFPHEFSGGQRQRIAIARAMVLKPKLVILDEPTSALDISVQAQIVQLLLKLQAQYQLAYLFISHDLKVIRALSDDIMVMKDGLVVETGPASEILNTPKDPYTQSLMQAAFH